MTIPPAHTTGCPHRDANGHPAQHDHTQQRASAWSAHPTLSRRAFLGVTGALAAGALAGCQQAAAPEPVTMATVDACDVCGMVIPNHPGPTTQIFYRDQRPSGHDNPARFDSTWEAFQYDFARDWDREVVYVTDYSSVEYTLSESGGDLLISTHPEAAAFTDAAAVTFVVGSDVKGAMGRDLIAFSGESDAEAFVDEYGGSLSTLDEVTPETIASLQE